MDNSNSRIVPLILAGGRGTRIAHLYPDLPKPAIPVAGRPFLAWILKQLHDAGFSRAVVSAGHLAEKLKSVAVPWIPDGMEVVWIEEQVPLGTGGGSAHAVRECGLNPKSWLVLNGDSYLAGDWPEPIKKADRDQMTIVAREMADTGRYGRLSMDAAHCLTSFSEKSQSGPGLINAGIYLIPDAWLRELPSQRSSSMEQDLIPAWLRGGRTIRLVTSQGDFLDVGTPESLALAEEFIRSNACHEIDTVESGKKGLSGE